MGRHKTGKASYMHDTGTPSPVTLGQASLYWLKLGFISFGGPARQIAIMHRDLVEKKNWISERRFLYALNFCMVLPGPEAQQLATYIGWLMHRHWGGIIAGALFMLPSFFLLIVADMDLFDIRQCSSGRRRALRHQAGHRRHCHFCRLSHRFKDPEYSLAMANRFARVHRPDNLQIAIPFHYSDGRTHRVLRRPCHATTF